MNHEFGIRISFSWGLLTGNVFWQHWIKDMKYSTKVKDEEGFPSFSLINKATGEAVKHSIGATHPVSLALFA